VKKFRRTVLHVGFDKTGSTAIQTAFDRCRGELARAAIHYAAGQWHAHLGSSFFDRPEQYAFNRLRGRLDPESIRREDAAYLARFEAELEASDAAQLVLSYEGFASMDAASLARFRDFLLRYSEQAVAVAYCRAPLAYALSALSQRVKTGVRPWIDAPILPFEEYLERLGDVFGRGNLVVRKFDRRSLPQGDVVRDFCTLFELPAETVERLATSGGAEVNPSLSREAFLIGARIIGLLDGRVPSGHEFWTRFSGTLGAIAGARLALSASEAAAVLARAGPHVAYLEKAHGLRFDEEPGSIADSPPGLSGETIDSLAAQFIKLLLPEPPKQREIRTGDLRIHGARLREGLAVAQGQMIAFDVDFLVEREVAALEMGIHIFDGERRGAFGVNNTLLGQALPRVARGSYRVTHHVIADLPTGKYAAGFAFSEKLPQGKRDLAWVERVCEFEVVRAGSRVSTGYAVLSADMVLRETALAVQASVIADPAGSLRALDPPARIAVAREVTVHVEARNDSDQTWVGDEARPIRFSYHWRDPSGRTVVFDGLRSPVPERGIRPGEPVRAEVSVRAPDAPGRYTLVLTMLQEHVAWFEAKGFAPAMLEMEVLAGESLIE